MSERGETSDGKILLVQFCKGQLVLSLWYAGWLPTDSRYSRRRKNLLDGIQDIRLAVFVPVGTDTQVDLAWVFVGFESLGDTWQKVSGQTMTGGHTNQELDREGQQERQTRSTRELHGGQRKCDEQC